MSGVVGTPYSGPDIPAGSDPSPQGGATVVASPYAGVLSSEPYDKFQAKLLAVPGLSSYVGTRVGQEWPADSQGFPAVAWKSAVSGLAKTDAEPWLGSHDLIQIDLLGDDFDTLKELARLIDESINDACNDRSWDTTHWKCLVVRRQSEWRRLEWPDRQTTTGNCLIQFTADFKVKFHRIQT